MPYYSTIATKSAGAHAAPKKAGGCGCGGGGGCGGDSCGCGTNACRGLSTMERPRYFSGQLLTEDELRSEQGYVLAKNRLHNRYLHGWGIVCGLQLTCDECPGYVAIHPGYGLDPRGNDVMVPCLQHYDVLQAIRECKEATRRQGCDPYTQAETNCADETEHWCVSVRYTEQQRRPSTALRQTAMSTGCGCSTSSAPSGGCGCGGSGGKSSGCGCGGAGKANSSYGSGISSGGGCGCGGSSGSGGSTSYTGGGHTSGGKTSATYATSSNLLLGACEPSRIVEGYDFRVCKSDGHCPEPADALKNTFVGRIVACFTGMLELAKDSMKKEDAVVVASAFTGTSSMARLSPAQQYASLCRFREFVLDVLESDAFGLSCGLPCAGYDIVIPQPVEDQDESGQDYADRSAEALKSMVALLTEHLRECLCQAIEPPCGPDPCDDDIPLGCVTISKDDVISVCSLSGRNYAGSFPAVAYWLSLAPVIAAALCRLCCVPLYRGRRAKRTALFAMLDSVDPSGALRKTAGAQGFAAPKYYAGQAKTLWKTIKLDKLLKKVSVPEEGVNVSAYLDQTPSKVWSSLKSAGLMVSRVRLEDVTEAPTVGMLTAPPVVAPGTHITVYEHDGEVLGYRVGGGIEEDDE